MRALRAQPEPAAFVSDPAAWRFMHLDYNPADPALFVATRQGSGWTLNFGRPLAIALIATLLTVGVGDRATSHDPCSGTGRS